MAGMHGAGVGTPKAAAVAAITIGLEGLVHIPKGIMLTIGLLSIILAIGVEVSTLFWGKTLSADGARPKLQAKLAPVHRQKLIRSFSSFLYVLSYYF